MKTQNRYLPYTPEELEKIKKLNDPVVMMYLYTGIRRFELRKILKNDREGDGYKIIGKGTKFRVIPAHPQVVNLVDKLSKTDGTGRGDKSINDHFNKLGKELGITKFIPHRCRATFATSMLENGINLVAIQTLLGHANISTTASYIKLSTNMLKNAIKYAIEPEYYLENMTPEEMKEEIIRLRTQLERSNNETTKN